MRVLFVFIFFYANISYTSESICLLSLPKCSVKKVEKLFLIGETHGLHQYKRKYKKTVNLDPIFYDLCEAMLFKYEFRYPTSFFNQKDPIDHGDQMKECQSEYKSLNLTYRQCGKIEIDPLSCW